MTILNFKSVKAAPTVKEGLEDYFEELNAPEDLFGLVLKVQEAIEEAGQMFFSVPYFIDLEGMDYISRGILLMEGCNYLAKNTREEDYWYDLKDRLASTLIKEGAYWDCSESWGYDCYCFWSPEAGQVSIHDPYRMVEQGPEEASENRVPQEWAGVPRQEYALCLLGNREWRRRMAAATDIRKNWVQRLPDIRFFYPEADEEGYLFSHDEYEEDDAA